MLPVKHNVAASLMAILAVLAMHVCVCVPVAKTGVVATAQVAAGDADDPHACCNRRAPEVPDREQGDPCESCPVKHNRGVALPDQGSKAIQPAPVMPTAWLDAPSPLAASSTWECPTVSHCLVPPSLLDLFHTHCQLTC